MQTTILQPMTPAEQARSQAESVLLHLGLCLNYAFAEKWGLAREALNAATRSIKHVDENLLGADLLRKLVVQFRKTTNCVTARITVED